MPTDYPAFSARKMTVADIGAHRRAMGGEGEAHRLEAGGRSYHPDNCIMLVEEDGQIIGSVFVVFARPFRWPDADDTSQLPQIISFVVKEGHRNRGAGTYLVGAVEEEIRSRGLDRLYLGVNHRDPAAIRLYKRLGFATISDEPYRTSWTYKDKDGVEQVEVEWLIDMVKHLS